MNIPTNALQLKLAGLIHDDVVKCKHMEEAGQGLANCGHRERYWIEAAFLVGKLMPTISREIFPVVRDDLRAKLHEKIIAELVCCDLYEKLNTARPADFGMTDDEWMKLSLTKMSRLVGMHYHSICHWGGYAASLVINKCPAGNRECEPLYFCPANGVYESPCHGGFDVCCANPELHQVIEEKTDAP